MSRPVHKSTQKIQDQVKAYFIDRYNNDGIRHEIIYQEISEVFGYSVGSAKHIVSIKDAKEAAKKQKSSAAA